MRLEEVLKQNYMGFILRLRNDEKKYDHSKWFAKGRFEEVFDIIKRLAIADAMKSFNERWKNDMDFLVEAGRTNSKEITVFSSFTNDNVAIILDSDETQFVMEREYVRKAFGKRLFTFHHEMNKSYNDYVEQVKRKNEERETKTKRWQARMAVETIEDGKHDVLYGGTERQIKNAYYEYYYNCYDNS